MNRQTIIKFNNNKCIMETLLLLNSALAKYGLYELNNIKQIMKYKLDNCTRCGGDEFANNDNRINSILYCLACDKLYYPNIQEKVIIILNQSCINCSNNTFIKIRGSDNNLRCCNCFIIHQEKNEKKNICYVI